MLSPFRRRLTKSNRCHVQNQVHMEQLEERTLLSGWTIGIDAGVGTVNPFYRQAVDPAGNVYVAGSLEGTADFDPSASTQRLLTSGPSGSAGDAFVARYSGVDGSLAWARNFSGVESSVARAVTYDPSGAGATVVAGIFSGSTDFTGDGIADATSVGGSDCFVVKLDAATGATLWFRTFGGTGSDRALDVAVLGGEIYTTGAFSNTADLNPGAGTFTLSATGKGNMRSPDAFVQRLDSSGNFLTAWQMGGKYGDQAVSLQVDAGGVSVLGDFTDIADFQPGSGTLNKTSAGQSDVFLARYSLTGSPVWVQTIGGAGSESAGDWSLAMSNDAIYVTGTFAGKLDVDPGTGSYVVDSGDTFNDALMAKYSKTNGAFVWARTYGKLGTHEWAGSPAAIDPVSGNVYFGGNFYGTLDFTPQIPGDELVSAGDRDSLLVKFDPQGNFVKAWRFGGAGWDSGARPAGVVGNMVYVAGWVYPGTADFPTGHTLTVADGQDMYVMGLNDAAATSSPLLAAAVPAKSIRQSLTVSQYERILTESLRRWDAAGVNTAALSGLNVQVKNLGGTTLGLASGNTIWLDDNAAGWGWFVDSTPGNSSEFQRFGNQGEQHRMDLLTVVMHELGHVLGQDHDADGVMAATLVAGVRSTSLGNEDTQIVDAVFSRFNESYANDILSAFPDEHWLSHRPRLQRRR